MEYLCNSFTRRVLTMSDKISGPLAQSSLPTKFGDFRITAFESEFPDFPHVVLSNVEQPTEDVVNVRIHSECMTGDVFSSVRCDCGEQLDFSLEEFAKKGGVLVYLRQEGRGIGLVNKLKAYTLQDQEGLDTIKANHALGFHTDERDYSPGIEILKALGIKKVNVYTNNPEKLDAFEGSGIEVVKRMPVDIAPREENRSYLDVKKKELGHMLGSSEE